MLQRFRISVFFFSPPNPHSLVKKQRNKAPQLKYNKQKGGRGDAAGPWSSQQQYSIPSFGQVWKLAAQQAAPQHYPAAKKQLC